MSGSQRRGVTIAETLMAGAIGAAMLGLLLPAISAAVANSQGSTCRNNLARVAQALNAYHDAKGKFPPSTQAASNVSGSVNGDYKPNWICLTLPFLGEQAVYDSVNWTDVWQTSTGLTFYSTSAGVRYGTFTSTEIPRLKCPSDPANSVQYRVRRSSVFSAPVFQYYGRTNYASNACLMPPFYFGDQNWGLGVNSVPCGGSTQASWALDSPYSWKSRGVMGLNTSVTRAQITDGTSKTILVAETRAGVNTDDPRGVWADGRAAGSTTWYHVWGPNYCYDDMQDSGALLNSLGGGAVAHQILLQQCMDAYNSSSGRPMGTFRSKHEGGLLAAMCDGSVRFISDSIQRGNFSPPGSVYAYYASMDASQTLTWERLNASADGLVLDDSSDPNFTSTATPYVFGDMNGDGVLDNFDISALELALGDPAAYLALYPNLIDYQQRGDINQDGSFDNYDIGAFEALLTGLL